MNEPTRKSPEGDPNNQDRETRLGGKNNPQALIVLLVRENKKSQIIIFSPRENQNTVRRIQEKREQDPTENYSIDLTVDPENTEVLQSGGVQGGPGVPRDPVNQELENCHREEP